MNKDLLSNIIRFVGLVIVQVFVMDQIELFGYISPIIYILFILWYPVENNRWVLLLLSFTLGLFIDSFQDTGGAHAVASVVLAFVRPQLLKISFGQGYLMKNLKVLHEPLDRFVVYAATGIILHHLILFTLQIYDTALILTTLKLTFVIGFASLIINTILFLTFSNKGQK